MMSDREWKAFEKPSNEPSKLEKLLQSFKPTLSQRKLLGQWYEDALRIANSIRMPFVYDEEKETIGIIGLVQAIQNYNGIKKVEFSTYLYRCIKQEIINAQIKGARPEYDIKDTKKIFINKKTGKPERKSNGEYRMRTRRFIRRKNEIYFNKKGKKRIRKGDKIINPVRIPPYKMSSMVCNPEYNDGEAINIFDTIEAPQGFDTFEFVECFNFIKNKLTVQQQEIFDMLIYPEKVLTNPKMYGLTLNDVKNKTNVDKTMVGKRYKLTRERARQIIVKLTEKVKQFFDIYGDFEKKRRNNNG